MIGPTPSLEDSRPAIGFVPSETPLRFDLDVADGGYAWWYVDAVSSDGSLALTMIAFVGSVFSPRYAKARRVMAAGGPPAEAERHCAINFAVYRRGGRNAWALTEHADVARDPATPDDRAHARSRGTETNVGTTSHRGRRARDQVRWTRRAPRCAGGCACTRLLGSARGSSSTGRVRARAIAGTPSPPTPRWRSSSTHPRSTFSGSGYHDVNEGDEGLELGFDAWNWSRGGAAGGRTAILYDVVPRNGRRSTPSLAVHPRDRTIEPIEPDALGSAVALSPDPLACRTLDPDRARTPASADLDPRGHALLLAQLGRQPSRGHRLIAVHESLDLGRFAAHRSGPCSRSRPELVGLDWPGRPAARRDLQVSLALIFV